MTPLRTSQARLAFEGLVLSFAPHMTGSVYALRDALADLVNDRELWAELDQRRKPLTDTRYQAAPREVCT